MRNTLISVVLLLCLTFIWASRPFENQQVLRVKINSYKDYKTVTRLDADIWSDHPGLLGYIDVRVNNEQKQYLVQRGLQFDVMISDLGNLIESEHLRLASNKPVSVMRAGHPEDINDWFSDYKKYADIVAQLQQWARDYPQFVSLKPSLGKSWENRDIWAMHITSPTGSNKNQILYTGMQHSREWISPMTVMFIATQLITQYGKEANITRYLDKLEFIIIPVTNPDGYEFSWGSSANRLWRKNRRKNSASYGVDMNRNWDSDWGGSGSSGDQFSDVYRGPSVFSEPETKCISNYVNTQTRIKAAIDFHSYSQLVLRPYGYTHAIAPDEIVLKKLGDGMRDAIYSIHKVSYVSETGGDLYLAAGGADDWGYMKGKTPPSKTGYYSYTIELRDTGRYGFVLPPAQITPTGEENLAAVRFMADFVISSF